MTAFPDSNPQPDPAASHLLADWGAASLPPPLHSSSDTAPLQDTAQDAATLPARPLPEQPLQERYSPQWIDLLHTAVAEPGLISEAYTRFHGYSLGNRFAALLQCQMREIEPGPLNTFNGWRKLGYKVQEGQKALCLCMPLKGTLTREKSLAPNAAATRDDPLPDIEAIEYIRAFVWKPHWFVLSQTQPVDPDNIQPVPTPTLNGWNKAQALAALNIQEVPFDHLDGNTQGFACKRGLAVSPLAVFPLKTFFHEMAHIVLGHTTGNGNGASNGSNGTNGHNAGTDEPLIDTMTLSRSQIEVEAEGVALLILDTFDLPGQEYARGYIQHWLKGEEIPEKSAQRIFGAADRILSAGLGEGRQRFPTAEDLGWTPSGTQDRAAAPGGTESHIQPATEAVESDGVAVNGISNGARHPVTALLPGHAGQLPRPARARSPSALVPLPTRQGENTEKSVTDLDHAWKLHQRLMVLHGQLHPEDREGRLSIAKAVRYLDEHDPVTATEVRRLITMASRSLKAAFTQLESVLDDAGAAPVTALQNGAAQNGTQDKAGGNTRGNPAITRPITPPAPQRAAPNGSTQNKRDLRGELQAEKDRFFQAAKARGLKVGGTHEKAMLRALGQFLRIPVESRRTPSARQWSLGASAIETRDLEW